MNTLHFIKAGEIEGDTMDEQTSLHKGSWLACGRFFTSSPCSWGVGGWGEENERETVVVVVGGGRQRQWGGGGGGRDRQRPGGGGGRERTRHRERAREKRAREGERVTILWETLIRSVLGLIKLHGHKGTPKSMTPITITDNCHKAPFSSTSSTHCAVQTTWQTSTIV